MTVSLPPSWALPILEPLERIRQTNPILDRRAGPGY
jgi:hypothetical protein